MSLSTNVSDKAALIWTMADKLKAPRIRRGHFAVDRDPPV